MAKRTNKTFNKQEGPCNQAIEKALKAIGVQRQAYYAGTFVGNHVHTCLKVTKKILSRLFYFALSIHVYSNRISMS